MKIPKDTGAPWRMDRFVEYHSLGDADMNFPILTRFADERGLTFSQRLWLAFLYSTCYCVYTTAFLFDTMPMLDCKDPQFVADYWVKYKPVLTFQSDKRYVKNMNWFPTIINNFMVLTGGKPARFFKTLIDFDHSGSRDSHVTYRKLYDSILRWQYFGRFTTFLLIEAIDKLTPIKADSDWFDWKNGNTATSGMMHVLYLDDEAVAFDQSGALSTEVKYLLDKGLALVREQIRTKYPHASTNISDIETALCGFRKLFKSTRYGGYYIDRVQEELMHAEKVMPEEHRLWNELWSYRRSAFPVEFLGEVQGWKGIRKERNYEWVSGGITGVEKAVATFTG